MNTEGDGLLRSDPPGIGKERSRGPNSQMEETMNKETQSYIDMLRNFGTNFGLPQVDVEKLIETNRKNIEALGEFGESRRRRRAVRGAEAARGSRSRSARSHGRLPAAISRSAIRRKSSPSRLSS